MAEYRRLTELSSTTPATQAPTDKRHYAPGTFGALVQDYLATAVYKEKKPSTRSEYRRVLESLQAQHGEKRVHMIKKRHIRKNSAMTAPRRRARPIPSSACSSWC